MHKEKGAKIAPHYYFFIDIIKSRNDSENILLEEERYIEL